ncbi:MAG: T9SS type A sorting domain-containing protein [Cytophagaceae bacterium]|jgi:hypothetical protein|nr:T9SS type A sorting domain-containing protein [Cytophagaceae bacterium]
MNLSRIIPIALLLACKLVVAQVNGFAKVTAISTVDLTVSQVNETNDSFEDGELVIIIQMQGASITGNTSNNTSFGQISAIQTSGLYEVARISSHTEASGVPTVITLTGPLANTYNPSASLQIVTFPTLGSPNFTTTSTITTLPWNGNIGGIVAFNVTGKLILNHSIDVSGRGFRGGNLAGNDGSGCITNTFISTSTNQHGDKGEGIFAGVYGNTGNAYVAGRAPITNGGGGGSVHNAGGGGGSNYSSGGDGGIGWSCGSSAGGMGGVSLNAYTNSSRIFMGGGGGGGQQNNSVGSAGANGGGIILIAADSIVAGTCGNFINANGANSVNAGNDGAGGAGAGGTIVLQAKGVRVNTGCSLVITANGGNGGNVNNGGTHGGGGGGGQGIIYTSFVLPVANTTVQTNNGIGGLNNNSGSATRAGSGTGPDGGGINNGVGTPLPLSIKEFTVVRYNGMNHIEWVVSAEENIDYYELLKSEDGMHWTVVTKKFAENRNTEVLYAVNDPTMSTKVYYKVLVHEKNGTSLYSQTIFITSKGKVGDVVVFPNPAKDRINISSGEEIQSVKIYTTFGNSVLEFGQNTDQIDISSLSHGYYILMITTQETIHSVDLIVE